MNYREWLVGTVLSIQRQTPTARSIILDVPGWSGSTAGQHVDVRLTAPDGYSTVRAYSLASTGEAHQVELAVDLIEDGEVSPYLLNVLEVGDQVEFRGPLGRWFVWKPDNPRPVQLVAGGSGVVPLIAMIRAHEAAASTAPMRLLYSVRSPADRFFAEELAATSTVRIDMAYTRETPTGWSRAARRVTMDDLRAMTLPPGDDPDVFVCGPTPFVETVADLLVARGHDAQQVRTERFGGSGATASTS